MSSVEPQPQPQAQSKAPQPAGRSRGFKIPHWILLIVALLVASPFIVALFLDRSFVVAREIVVDRPRPEVFAYVQHLKNQVNYSKWFMSDPAIKTSYRGDDGTVGFVMGWESDSQDVGSGEQEITKVVDGDRVQVEIRIREPFVSTNTAYTATESLGPDKTKVKAVYLGKIDWPMNLLCGSVAESLGEAIQGNLERLKQNLEKQGAPAAEK